MRSLILRTTALGLLPTTLLFAAYLLWRGHHLPGGGFIAGLVVGAALVVHGLAFGGAATRARFSAWLTPAAPLGLAIALASGLPAVLAGRPYLTHFHGAVPVPGHGPVAVSTALVFDLGVFLVVVGVTAALLAALAEGDDR